jgi:hypothetical protein
MVGVYSRAVREREVRKKREEERGKKKKAQIKPHCRAQESNPRTHEILFTSQVFYPLDHGATPITK